GRTATRLPERRGVMTTTDRRHLTYPDTARLKQRLADAEAQRLILFDYKENPIDPFSFEARAKCTPSEKVEPYHVFMRWDIIESRAYLLCTCPAGYHQGICKHAALLHSAVTPIGDDLQVRVLSPDEMQRYETLALLPDWEV